MKLLRNFIRDEQGQDMVEYVLLLAFVAMAAAALFTMAGSQITAIWSKANSELVAANTGI